MKINKKVIEKYNSNFKRKSNFIEKLKSKRVARKACAGLWVKTNIFLENRSMHLLHMRLYLRRNGFNVFKWTYKEKEYKRDNTYKMFYFYNLYSKKRKLNEN